MLDPFAGSSTTGIAANLIGRRFIGIETSTPFLNMSRLRRIEFDEERDLWARRIPDLAYLHNTQS